MSTPEGTMPAGHQNGLPMSRGHQMDELDRTWMENRMQGVEVERISL